MNIELVSYWAGNAAIVDSAQNIQNVPHFVHSGTLHEVTALVLEYLSHPLVGDRPGNCLMISSAPMKGSIFVYVKRAEDIHNADRLVELR